MVISEISSVGMCMHECNVLCAETMLDKQP